MKMTSQKPASTRGHRGEPGLMGQRLDGSNRLGLSGRGKKPGSMRGKRRMRR
jgi:hypothetical protein